MRLTDSIKVRGSIRLLMADHLQRAVLERRVDNLATQLGADLFAARCFGTGISPISHIALGSGSAAPAAGDTALVTELGRAALFASSYLNGIATLKAYFGPNEATGLLAEVGLFNAGVNGLLSNRAIFQPFTKGATNVVTVTWNLQFVGV